MVTRCCLCGHALPGPIRPFATITRRAMVVCAPCDEAGIDLLLDLRDLDTRRRGAVIAALRDNGMGALADFVLGLLPFEVVSGEG